MRSKSPAKGRLGPRSAALFRWIPVSSVGLVLALAGSACAPRGTMASAPDVLTLDGARIDPLAGPEGRLALFVFLSEGCPIARTLSPEIERLGRRAIDAGVSVALVYPDPFARPEEIRAHHEAFGLSLPAFRDPRHDVVNAVGATISPEAALIRFRKGGGFDLLYRGRINDLYAAPGRRRPSATSHDLEAALEAALAGRAPDPTRTEAVGCIIEPLRDPGASASPTHNANGNPTGTD